MKIAILNDTHCGIRNSSEIFMDYQEKFYRGVFFPALEVRGIKKILHLGDYYENRTSINFKALHHNRRIFLDVLRDSNIHMDIIPGNHDVYFKNTNKLNALKELLGHYMNEVRIIEQPTVEQYGSLKMALIPWINPENEKKTFEFLDNCTADMVGAHLELAGFEMQKGIPCSDGMAHSLFSKFEAVLSGHFHTKSSIDNVYYLGSQMQFFWNDCDDRKYFHVLDTETRDMEAIENPITIFEKVYYDGREIGDLSYLDKKFVKLIVVNKADPQEFEKLVDRINLRSIFGLQIVENFQDFVGANVDDDKISVEDTESLLYTYIDAVDTDLDKDRIKSEVHRLMIEAQTLEIA